MTVIINAFVRFDFSVCEIFDLEKLVMVLSAIAYARSSLTIIPSISSVYLYRYPLLDMKILISSYIRYIGLVTLPHSTVDSVGYHSSHWPPIRGGDLGSIFPFHLIRQTSLLPGGGFFILKSCLTSIYNLSDQLTYIYLYHCWENSWLF